jgi:hypothetical protein
MAAIIVIDNFYGCYRLNFIVYGLLLIGTGDINCMG